MLLETLMSDPDSCQKAFPHPPEGFLVFFGARRRRVGGMGRAPSCGYMLAYVGLMLTHVEPKDPKNGNSAVKCRIFLWSVAYLGAMLGHLGAMLAYLEGNVRLCWPILGLCWPILGVPQRRAFFRHNFQKWSENGVFCTFSLRNALRATTACTFSTSEPPKVVRTLVFCTF